MNTSSTLGKLASALVKAQEKFPVVEKNATNPYFKSKYAELGDVLKAAIPVLAAHELAVIQAPFSKENEVGVTTTLLHSSGEFISEQVSIPMLGAKNPAQEAGAIITYLRRYSLAGVLGMYSDEDVDAQTPSKPQPTATATPNVHTPEQAVEKATELKETKYNWASERSGAIFLAKKLDRFKGDKDAVFHIVAALEKLYSEKKITHSSKDAEIVALLKEG